MLKRDQKPIYRSYNAASDKLEYSSDPNAPYIMENEQIVLPNQEFFFAKTKLIGPVYQCDADFIEESAHLQVCKVDDHGTIIRQGRIWE